MVRNMCLRFSLVTEKQGNFHEAFVLTLPRILAGGLQLSRSADGYGQERRQVQRPSPRSAHANLLMQDITVDYSSPRGKGRRKNYRRGGSVDKESGAQEPTRRRRLTHVPTKPWRNRPFPLAIQRCIYAAREKSWKLIIN